MANPLDFAGACRDQKTGMVVILRPDTGKTRDQRVYLCFGSFLDFFPFSRRSQHYSVVSTVMFKLFHDSIY